MCVSTGKAGMPKPCDITTLAVLCPTPGSFSRLLKLFGTFPSYFSFSILDNSEIDFDFFGPSPQGFMILYISSTLSLLIENASLPAEKSSGVILLNSRELVLGSRILGPVCRELRQKNYTKILAMSPVVI